MSAEDIKIWIWIACALTAWSLLLWRLRRDPTTYGSATWMKVWRAVFKRLFKRTGLMIGDWIVQTKSQRRWRLPALLPIFYRDDAHCITISPAGSGKGTSAIIPNLLRWPWVFLMDPGGENTAVAAGHWREQGYSFYCINPWRMHEEGPWELPHHALNPLDILEPAGETFTSDADVLADALIVRSGREDGSSEFFKNEAQSVIKAMIMHIASTEPAERRNLLTLREYITADQDTWEKLLSAMKRNVTGGGAIRNEALALERREAQDATEELSAIMSTMKEVTNFLDDPAMQASLCSSEVEISDLKSVYRRHDGRKQKGCIVSVVTPLAHLQTHAPWLRLVTAVAIWTMQCTPMAKNRVLFLLDEFAALGRMDRIAGGLETLRKHKVWLWPIFQSLAQIKDLYHTRWPTFLANAGFRQFLAVNDPDTARYVSDMCGTATVETETRTSQGELLNRGQTARPLITPDEVLSLPSDQQICFIAGERPLLARKRPYWKRPELRGRYQRNPYHGRTPGLGILWPLQWVLGQLVKGASYLLAPHPLVGAAYIAAALIWLQPGIRVHGNQSACEYITLTGIKETYPREHSCAPVRVWANVLVNGERK